jgi:hypothetical protein
MRLANLAGNPAVVGFPLDRWLCDPAFRQVCLCQLKSDRYTAQIALSISLVNFGRILSNRFSSVHSAQKRQLSDPIHILFLRPRLAVRNKIQWEKSRNVTLADVQSDRLTIVKQKFCKQSRGDKQP